MKAILLVEGSDHDALLFRVALAKADLPNPVYRTVNAEEALAWLEGEGEFGDRARFPVPSILFLNLKLPGMSGFQFLEWISRKARFRNMLVVVLTGAGKIDEVTKACEIGANSFMSKPGRVEDLRNLAAGFAAYWRD